MGAGEEEGGLGVDHVNMKLSSFGHDSPHRCTSPDPGIWV